MPDARVTLTVTDPHYRGRILATHHELSATEARELGAIYRALGYAAPCLTVVPAPMERAA